MGKKRAAKPRIVDHVEDSDDEEIDEDEAFNSDDERKYGSFFDKQDDADDDEEGSSDDTDDDEESEGEAEGDGGKYMLDLLKKLDDNGDADDQKPKSIAPHVKESQFSASVVPQAGLTMDSLMDGLKDTKGFGVVQKSMRKVAQGQAAAVPLPKVISDRAQRKVHYEIQSQDVSQWNKAVQQNRNAETLDFRPKERLDVTRDVMVDKFVPTSDFEKQIHAALQQAGAHDEEQLLRQEEDALQDDLGTNEITLDEYKRRRGQLAKMRSLMFYHEQKRHQINKIKSKKYRRIRKKQRERDATAEEDAALADNPDLARELLEKEEVERMKERATLAHKNTSKWAKRVLKRGKNVDVDTRRALSAQLQRGDDLRKRMSSTRDGGESSDDEGEDLAETARKVLEDVDDGKGPVTDKKGIFALSFMQKGIEKQRERAKQEARELLLELQDGEDDTGILKDADDGSSQSKKKKKKVASEAEMKHILKDGAMVASAPTTSVAVSGDINIDVGFHNGEKNKAGRVSEHSSTLVSTGVGETGVATETAQQQASKKKASTPSIAAVAAAAAANEQDESNPWLTSAGDESPKEAKVADSKTKLRTTKRGFVDVDRAVDLLESTPAATKAALDTTTASDGPVKKITMLTQEELVAKAFCAPSEQEIDAEFAREKELAEEREDPMRKKKKEKEMVSQSGWGSWAGHGALPPSKPMRLPKKLQPPPLKTIKRKRADEKKPRVILSETRVKKTAKFMLSQIPYPFTSREEYERSMAGGVGLEWNVTQSFKDMTRPEVVTRAGKVIQPISRKVKQANRQQRGPAKF